MEDITNTIILIIQYSFLHCLDIFAYSFKEDPNAFNPISKNARCDGMLDLTFLEEETEVVLIFD